MKSVAIALVVVGLALSPVRVLTAQGRDVPPRATDQSQLARAWTAFAAGRYADAARLCDEVLRAAASLRHDALALKIRIDAAQADVSSALDDYDRWTKGRADTMLLEPVGERVLQQLTGAADLGLRSEAAVRLRRAERPIPAGPHVDDTQSRAASGDAAAREQLLREIATGDTVPRRTTIEALAQGGASAAQLAPLLTNRSPDVRAAAIEAIGATSTPEAVQALSALRDDPDPYIRLTAIVALARAGDAAARTAAREALANPVADIRLTAAGAFHPPTPESLAAIRAALDDPDPVTRLKAAELLAPEEPSMAVVTALLWDPNPAIREEAAKVVEDRFPDELTLIRPMLLSSDPWSRLHAAGALLHYRSR